MIEANNDLSYADEMNAVIAGSYVTVIVEETMAHVNSCDTLEQVAVDYDDGIAAASNFEYFIAFNAKTGNAITIHVGQTVAVDEEE